MKPIYRQARQIQISLELSVNGAIRGTPLTEPDKPGALLAEEIARHWRRAESADAILSPTKRDEGEATNIDDEPEDPAQEAPYSPVPVFWTPPSIDPEEVYGSLADAREGDYLRQSKLLGIDAYGYYASFHQRQYQWGVYMPLEGVAALARHAFAGLRLGPKAKFELAWHFVLSHERFHYAADCGVGQLELILNQPIWWPTREHSQLSELKLAEEELATGFSLREAARPPRDRSHAGAYQALKAFSMQLPKGYKDGYSIATSRNKFENRMLDHAQLCVELATGRSYLPAEMHHLYPAYRPYDLERCPIHVVAPPDTGGAVLIQRIDTLVEGEKFMKALERYANGDTAKWQKTKSMLATSVFQKGLDFKPWPKAGRDWFSVRIDKSMRAHLRFESGTGTWFAEEFGPHTKMGHG